MTENVIFFSPFVHSDETFRPFLLCSASVSTSSPFFQGPSKSLIHPYPHHVINVWANPGADLGGRVQGVRTPPWDVPHRSVTSFLRGAPLLRKILDPPLESERSCTECQFLYAYAWCRKCIGHCSNVRGLGKSMVVFCLFEKLRYSNKRWTKFESLYHK